jgi:hypothetical protein
VPYILTLVFAGVPMFMMEVNIIGSASEPDSMSPDPDPIRIQGFYDQKFSKLTTENFFLSKNCSFTYPQASIKASELQEKPSALKREHPAFQNMKFFYLFLFLWVIFALLDLDPDPDLLT